MDLNEHLEKARAERKPENLIAGAAKARQKLTIEQRRAAMAKCHQQRILAKCNCNTSSDKHKSTCPVGRRDRRQQQKGQGQ